MSKPNLFNYATSELSQDAIICWLLEWAKQENKEIDNKMHTLGINFIDSLFIKYQHVKKPDHYHTVEVKKQYKSIDVLCIVNNEFAILIEDKINTKNHSNQLQNYFTKVKKDFSKTQILPIYFKTGDQSSYEDILSKGYSVYSRKDFLTVLGSVEYDNHILNDYHRYLQTIEDSVNSFKILAFDKWTWNSWKGFYKSLREKLGEGNWDYVANPSGGFLGFWWSFEGDEDCKQYLQIESQYNEKIKAYSTKLCIKILVKDANNRKIFRKFWYEKLKEKVSEYNLAFKKPSRFGTGTFMTILVLENDYRQMNSDGMINMYKTMKYLDEAKALIKSVQ